MPSLSKFILPPTMDRLDGRDKVPESSVGSRTMANEAGLCLCQRIGASIAERSAI